MKLFAFHFNWIMNAYKPALNRAEVTILQWSLEILQFLWYRHDLSVNDEQKTADNVICWTCYLCNVSSQVHGGRGKPCCGYWWGSCCFIECYSKDISTFEDKNTRREIRLHTVGVNQTFFFHVISQTDTVIFEDILEHVWGNIIYCV